MIDGGAAVLDGAARAEDVLGALRKITRQGDSFIPQPRLFEASMAF